MLWLRSERKRDMMCWEENIRNLEKRLDKWEVFCYNKSCVEREHKRKTILENDTAK